MKESAVKIDWKELLMLFLRGDLEFIDVQVVSSAHPTEFILDDHTAALIEDAFRDWMWEKHGRLIAY